MVKGLLNSDQSECGGVRYQRRAEAGRTWTAYYGIRLSAVIPHYESTKGFLSEIDERRLTQGATSALFEQTPARPRF